MQKITAYRTNRIGELKKGDPSRKWMDFTFQRFAYGCLPLIIANELGWDIICQTSFKALWNGDTGKDSIIIQFSDQDNPSNVQVDSHFGHGVLTFHPNFLFKTDSGQNLYVKGVPNMLKDAIQPLEGVVETDWLPLTFTMNWKFTRPNVWIEFSQGEPIARILPYPRGYIENFDPTITTLESNEEVKRDLEVWGKDRKDFNEKLKSYDGDKVIAEKNYFKGIDKNANKIDFHQKKIAVKEFRET